MFEWWMNIMYENHIIFMGVVHIQFKSYQVSVGSTMVFIFLNVTFTKIPCWTCSWVFCVLQHYIGIKGTLDLFTNMCVL